MRNVAFALQDGQRNRRTGALFDPFGVGGAAVFVVFAMDREDRANDGPDQRGEGPAIEGRRQPVVDPSTQDPLNFIAVIFL